MAGDETRSEAPAPPPLYVNLPRLFLGVFALAALLYALGVNDQWRFQRDSALYMSLGRAIAETGTFSHNYAPHTFVWPGFPALLSLVYMTVGESFLIMNAIVTLMGLACIVAGWAVLRQLRISAAQMGACLLLFAFSRHLYYYSTHIMTEIPFTLLALAGLWCGLRMVARDDGWSWLWCVAAAACATGAQFVRPFGVALALALPLALWLRRPTRRRIVENLGKSLVIAAPFVTAVLLWRRRCEAVRVPGSSWQRSYSHLFLSQRRSSVVVDVLERIPDLAKAAGDVVFGTGLGLAAGVIVLAVAFVGMVCLVRRGDRLLCVYGGLCLGAACLGSPGPRYLVPVLLVLLVWCVVGAEALWRFGSRRRPLAWGAALLACVLVLNVARIALVVRESRAEDFYAATGDERLTDYFALADWLEANAPPDRASVIAKEGRFLHYFARVRARDIWPVVTPRILKRGAPMERIRRETRRGDVYVVVDPDKDPPIVDKRGRRTGERVMAHVRDESPEVFTPVARFGELQLLKVRPDRLPAPPEHLPVRRKRLEGRGR